MTNGFRSGILETNMEENMGKRGPFVSEQMKQDRAKMLRSLLRDRKAGRCPQSFTDLCAAMGYSAPTVRKIAREAGIDLRS